MSPFGELVYMHVWGPPAGRDPRCAADFDAVDAEQACEVALTHHHLTVLSFQAGKLSDVHA